jgi:UDP-3-O-[3-hydroxymyristoyl] glucosamine N-acyltransferase
MSGVTIGVIAERLGASAEGNLALEVDRASEPGNAGPSDLALAMSPSYAEALSAGAARAALVWPGADWRAMGLQAAILAPRPRLAMSGVTRIFDPGQGVAPGRHPSAIIDPTAELAPDVAVGPLTVIGARARIGAGSVIGPQCSIGADTTIGAGAMLREMVSIGARVTIGDRFFAQPGARIGGDGFSYVTEDTSNAESARETLTEDGDAAPTAAPGQPWLRIHSLGAVTIGDDVEIGANATVDNGTIRDTTIGNGTKIDNLVQVGHNVSIGRDCLLCGQVGIAGSTRIGNNVVLGGQTGVVDNIYIGDGVVSGGGTKILSNVPAGRVIMGYPATKIKTNVESYKALRRLPRLLRDVAALQKAVFKGEPSR